MRHRYKTYRQGVLFSLLMLLSLNTWAQKGIGTNEPNKAAALDVKSKQRGLLIPRVTLESETDQAPITPKNELEESLLVYNEGNNLDKGYYYWYDDAWLRLLTEKDKPSGGGSDDGEGEVSEVWFKQDDEGELATENEEAIYHKGSVAIGKTNNFIDEAIFEVYMPDSSKNALTVLKDGWVGIGADEPNQENKYYNLSEEILPYLLQDENQTEAMDDVYESIIFNNDLIGDNAPDTDELHDIIDEAIADANFENLGEHKGNEKLMVNGSILAKDYYFPDYVFEHYFDDYSESNPHYKFNSLATTKEFIEQNHHLPGIQPASALNKTEDGAYEFNLSNLSVKSLEKIEELYLYAIEQEEEIEHLEHELKTLKEDHKNTIRQQEQELKALEQEQKENEERLQRLEEMVDGD